MSAKKRILLNWDTTRPDLLEPFYALKNDFEFIIVWEQEKQDAFSKSPFRQIFYNDFKTPYQLIKKINPDKVLFFNINSFPQIALNLAAKNLGIPTFTMHHGIYSSDSLEINKKKEQLGLVSRKKLWHNNFSTLFFYLSALKLKNIDQLFKYLYFPVIRKRRNRVLALERMVFEARLPTRLIQLSPYNATIDKQIHRLPSDQRFLYIGHPFFDAILKRLSSAGESQLVSGRFFLLIDFANIDSSIAFKTLTRDGKHDFYKRLSDIAKSFGCRLKIKLHPAGFDSPYNYKDDNIDLIYDEDVVPLILNAEKCFSFYSTLIIPIIYKKKFCYLFDTGMKIALQDELVELGVALMLKTNSFTPDDLSVHKGDGSDKGYETFIERYLYYTDGNATGRLKNILINDEAA